MTSCGSSERKYLLVSKSGCLGERGSSDEQAMESVRLSIGRAPKPAPRPKGMGKGGEKEKCFIRCTRVSLVESENAEKHDPAVEE